MCISQSALGFTWCYTGRGKTDNMRVKRQLRVQENMKNPKIIFKQALGRRSWREKRIISYFQSKFTERRNTQK